MTENDILRKAVLILEKRAKYNVRSETFASPDHVKRYLQLHFASIEDGAEHFTVLYLDNRNRLIAAETPFHGTIDSAAVYPRELLKRALHHHSNGLILAHNHPSGDPAPSDSDIRLTKKISEVMAMCDIRVIDHVIVGDRSGHCLSLAERSLM